MKSKYFIYFMILLVVISTGCVEEKNGEQVSTPEVIKGEDIYLANCASCHGPQGRGDGPMASNIPEPPKDLTAVKGKSDAELEKTIKTGVEAAGMPAYEDALSEEEIYNVIEYMRNL